jgi:putative ABC transport system permease protein
MLRRAGVMAMVAGAAVVLVAPLAAVPLFLSSVGTASVAVQTDERCPRDTGASYTTPVATDDLATPSADPLGPIADLGPTTRWMRSDIVRLTGADPAAATQAVVMARDGAPDHVDVVAGTPGPGAWLTDRAATETGLGPGDTATIGGAPVPVRGVYRDLAGKTVDDFWCAHGDPLLVDGVDYILPAPLVLVDPATFAGWTADLGVDQQVAVTWEAPLREGLTVADAQGLVDDLACASPTRTELEWCADRRPSGAPGLATGTVRRGSQLVPGVAPQDSHDFVSRYFATHLPFVIDRAGSIRTSVGGGVWPIAGCAALAGAGFVAAAGALWSDRRRREVTLLTVRGVSPAALGLKAILELIVPLVAGALGGIGLAYGLVRWLGPSPGLEPSALGRAVLSGAAGLVAAMLTVGIVVARRVEVPRARTHHRAWLRLVPWELGLAGVTLVSYRRLGEWGVPVSDGAEVSRVDPLGLLFPVLFLLTGVAVAARILLLGLGPLRAVSRGWPTSLYLAVRRVARYRVAVVGLVAASAVAAGVLGYAATLNRSLDATLDLKARAFVGSDVAVSLADGEQLPESLAPRATEVDSYRPAWIDTGHGRAEVTVLAVDPATFADATFWDRAFSDRGLDDILDLLDRPAGGTRGGGGTGGGGALPAVVTGLEGLPDTVDAGITCARTTELTITPVARPRLPGHEAPHADRVRGRRRPDRPRPHHPAHRDLDPGRPRPDPRRPRRRQRPLPRTPPRGRRRRPGVVPHRGLDLRLRAGHRRGRRPAGAGRPGRLPRRPPPAPHPELRLRPPHGPDLGPAPPGAAGRAGRQRGGRLLAGARHRPGRGVAGPRPHRSGAQLPARARAAPGHDGDRGPGHRGHGRRRGGRHRRPAPGRRRQPGRRPPGRGLSPMAQIATHRPTTRGRPSDQAGPSRSSRSPRPRPRRGRHEVGVPVDVRLGPVPNGQPCRRPASPQTTPATAALTRRCGGRRLGPCRHGAGRCRPTPGQGLNR